MKDGTACLSCGLTIRDEPQPTQPAKTMPTKKQPAASSPAEDAAAPDFSSREAAYRQKVANHVAAYGIVLDEVKHLGYTGKAAEAIALAVYQKTAR